MVHLKSILLAVFTSDLLVSVLYHRKGFPGPRWSTEEGLVFKVVPQGLQTQPNWKKLQ